MLLLRPSSSNITPLTLLPCGNAWVTPYSPANCAQISPADVRPSEMGFALCCFSMASLPCGLCGDSSLHGHFLLLPPVALISAPTPFPAFRAQAPTPTAGDELEAAVALCPNMAIYVHFHLPRGLQAPSSLSAHPTGALARPCSHTPSADSSQVPEGCFLVPLMDSVLCLISVPV